MNDWHYFFNHVPNNLADSTYRIFDEQYKTEIFNWFRREDVTKEQKEEFIAALVDFSDDCGDFYRYRAYLLAAEALNYFPDCSRGDAIAWQILKWSYGFFRQDKQDWQIVPEPLVAAARVALEKTDRNRVVSAFVHLVHTTESKTILRLAAEKLGKLDPGNRSAIAALVLLFQVTQERRTLLDISRSLIHISSDNLAVISTLVKLIRVNTDGWSNLDCRWHKIYYAADVLGKVAIGNKIAINTLVHLMQTTTDRCVHECAINSLGEIATRNEAAINALIKMMQTTADKSICLDAIGSLGKIATGNQTAIVALTEFLQINQGDRICLDAAIALWQIDEGNSSAIAALLEIIANSTDGFFLSEAASYLVQFQPKNVAAISALTERIETTQNMHIRLQAAASLLEFNIGNELAIETLSEIIQGSDCIGYHLEAAYSLLPTNFGNQLATATLVNYILERDDPSIRSYLEDLCNLEFKDPNAIAALTQFIASTKYSLLLPAAAYSLGKIDPGNQTAISTLIQFIHQPVEVDAIDFHDAEDEGEYCSYNFRLSDAADKLQEILLIDQMWQVVVALKDYISKSKRDSSYRYEACYNLIWHCAQKMPYPDFYKAWHSLP